MDTQYIRSLIEEINKHDIIMFDFDNTLVDSLKYWYKVQDKLAYKHYNIKPNKAFFEKRKDKINNQQAAKAFIEITNIEATANQVLKFWHEKMLEFYTTKIKPIIGIKEFLFKLKNNGKKLVIASATDINLLKKALKHFNLNVFDEIFTEETIGYCKSYPEFFEVCLDKLNATYDNVFFFEDSFGSISSAARLNIQCCAVIHKFNKQHKKEFENICKFTIKNYKKLWKF